MRRVYKHVLMPGRLMVGRMALDHVVKVRVLPGQSFYVAAKKETSETRRILTR